jgi:hypothetical protein
MVDIKQLRETVKSRMDSILYTEKTAVKQLIIETADKGHSSVKTPIDPRVADVIIKELKRDGFSVIHVSAVGYDDPEGYKISWY